MLKKLQILFYSLGLVVLVYASFSLYRLNNLIDSVNHRLDSLESKFEQANEVIESLKSILKLFGK